MSLRSALLAPAPPERLAALRMLTGGFAVAYLCIRGFHLQSFGHVPASHFQPVGVASILAAPLPIWAVRSLLAAALASGAAYALGYRFRAAGPMFGALLLWVTTYRNSWGMVFHTENLMVLHVLAIGLAPAADAWSLDARRRAAMGEALERDDRRYGWPIRLVCALTVTTYFLAGIAKLRNSGIAWVTTDILRNYVAYDNVRKIALGDTHAPLGGALVRHAWLFHPLAAASLAIELGAPLALLHRRIALVFCAGAWFFHVGVLATMAVLFPYPLLGVAFAGFFEIERRFTGRRGGGEKRR